MSAIPSPYSALLFPRIPMVQAQIIPNYDLIVLPGMASYK